MCFYMPFLRKLLLFPAVLFHMKKHSYPPAAWPLLNLWRPVMTVPMSLHRLYHTGSCCRTTVTPMAAEKNRNILLEMNRKRKITASLAFFLLPLTSFLQRPVVTRLVGASPRTIVLSFKAWTQYYYYLLITFLIL